MRTSWKRASALLVALALGLPAPWAAADQIRLRDGDTVDGTILEETEGFFVIKTLGGVRVIQKSEIEDVRRDDPPGAQYAKRRAALALDDAEGHYRLGLWCLDVGLPFEARDEFLKTIRIAPDHAGARRQLGYAGGPGRWYRPYLGEKPPPGAPKEEGPAAPRIPAPPDPRPAPNPGLGSPRGEDEPIAEPGPERPAVPVVPPPAADSDWVQLIVKETVLGKPVEQSNLRPRIVNALRWGANPPFRIRPEGDDRPCRWRIEVAVDAEFVRENTFMGLGITKVCAGRASVLVIDPRTLKRVVEIRGISEEYTLADLEACARYALWKTEDALLERIRRHEFFRMK